MLRAYGTPERPRLIIRRSLKNLFAQTIDDTQKKIILSISTFDKKIKPKFPSAGNIKAASLLGEIFAERLKESGVKKIIFDRGGYLFHGRVKAFAEGLRKGGMEF